MLALSRTYEYNSQTVRLDQVGRNGATGDNGGCVKVGGKQWPAKSGRLHWFHNASTQKDHSAKSRYSEARRAVAIPGNCMNAIAKISASLQVKYKHLRWRKTLWIREVDLLNSSLIRKVKSDWSFKYMRPSQYNGGELQQRPNSACGRLSSMSCGSQRPWNGAQGQLYKSVKPPLKNMNFGGINQVVNKPLPRTGTLKDNRINNPYKNNGIRKSW